MPIFSAMGRAAFKASRPEWLLAAAKRVPRSLKWLPDSRQNPSFVSASPSLARFWCGSGELVRQVLTGTRELSKTFQRFSGTEIPREPIRNQPLCGSWYIWIRLPHVSEKIASFTGPTCFGSVVNLTACCFRRFASASMSSTSKAARGIPCLNIAS